MKLTLLYNLSASARTNLGACVCAHSIKIEYKNSFKLALNNKEAMDEIMNKTSILLLILCFNFPVKGNGQNKKMQVHRPVGLPPLFLQLRGRSANEINNEKTNHNRSIT